MFVVNELIRVEDGGALSFGNHMAASKQKVRDFEVKGDMYNLKTHKEITRLEKNERLLFEAVPGASVENFVLGEDETAFTLYGAGDTQITLELEPSVQYAVNVGGAALGDVKTTLAGKLVFSAELSALPVCVSVKRI